MERGYIFESSGEYRVVLARVFANLLLLAGCLFALSAEGIRVGWRLEVTYALFALGVVCFVEVNWRREPPLPKLAATPLEAASSNQFAAEGEEERKRRAKEEYEEQVQEQKRQRRSGWIKASGEFAAVVLMAFLTSLLAQAWAPRARAEAMNQQPPAHGDGAGLAACQTELGQARAQLANCGAALDDERKKLQLVEKMWDSLQKNPSTAPAKRTSNASAQEPSSWFALSPGEVLIALLVLITLIAVARKHKEAVPVAGAAALAGEALEHAGELARMEEPMYNHLLWTFLIVSGALTLLFLIAAVLALKARAPSQSGDAAPQAKGSTDQGWFAKLAERFFDRGEEKPQTRENYITSLGFSIVVLLWAAVLVAYKGESHAPAVDHPALLKGRLTALPLAPLRPFQPGSFALQGLANREGWKEEFSAIDRGDVLLLLGSADCRPFRQSGPGHDNAALARERAQAVQAWLKPEMDARGVQVEVQNLDQHARCREEDELRAVYPFLIHDTRR